MSLGRFDLIPNSRPENTRYPASLPQPFETQPHPPSPATDSNPKPSPITDLSPVLQKFAMPRIGGPFALLRRKWPTPVWEPMAPFIIAGAVVYYGVWQGQTIYAASEEFRNDPRNPSAKPTKVESH